MSESFFTKDKIGANVVLMPLDNAVNRSKGSAFDQAFEAVITNIARGSVTVAKPDGNQIGVYKIGVSPQPTIQNNSNYGYWVFSSCDEFNSYRVAQKVKARLRDDTMYGTSKITDEQYSKIAELLGWDDLLSFKRESN